MTHRAPNKPQCSEALGGGGHTAQTRCGCASCAQRQRQGDASSTGAHAAGVGGPTLHCNAP